MISFLVGELASIKAQVTPLLDYCAGLIPKASLGTQQQQMSVVD